MNLVSKAEYARMRGCTPQTINSFIQEQLVVLVGKKVDVDESNRRLSDIYDNSNYDFSEAKTREKNFQAKLAELEYQEAVDILVKKDDVIKDARDIGIKIKNMFLAMPNRISNELIEMSDKLEIENFLKSNIVQILEQMQSKYMNG